MAPVGFKRETLVSEPDAQTTRPPPCATAFQKKFIGNCSLSLL